MDVFDALKDLLFFLLGWGAKGSLAIAIGASAGLLAGLAACLLCYLPLTISARRRRDQPNPPSPWPRRLLLICWLLTVAPIGVLIGGTVGAGKAAAGLAEDTAALRELVDLSCRGAVAGLKEADERLDDAEAKEQIRLALDLLEGEKTYPVESIGAQLDGFSASSLEKARSTVRNIGLGADEDGNKSSLRFLATALSQRGLTLLIEQRTEAGHQWLEPIHQELAQHDEDGDGFVTGRDFVVALVKTQLARRLGKALFWSVVSTALPALLIALALLIGPLVLWAIWRLIAIRRQRTTSSPS